MDLLGMTIDPVTAHFTHMVPLSIVSLSYTDHVDDDGVQMMRSEDIELKPIILDERSYRGYYCFL